MYWLPLVILLTVTGCADHYDAGYRQGIVDTRTVLKTKEREWRNGMLETVPRRLTPCTTTALLVLLFGDRLLNLARQALWKYFHFSRRMQMLCFQWTFRVLILLAAGWTAYRMPMAWLLPLLPLLSGMCFLTEHGIQHAFDTGPPELLRLVLTKLKTLLFLSLTLFFLYELLSGTSVIKLLPC